MIHPTTGESVHGVARILTDTVLPSVVDTHARAQLAQAITVLRTLDADDAAFALLRADADLRTLLVGCDEWIDADADRRATFGSARPTSGPIASFATLVQQHEANRALLAMFVIEMARWRETHAGDDITDRVRDHLTGRAKEAT